MSASVEIVATRGDRELFATITLEPMTVKNKESLETLIETTTEKVRSIQDDIDDDDEVFG